MSNINVTTMNEISAQATAIVGRYIEDGYIMNIGTMSGSQSNMPFYADLVKGHDTIRVCLHETTNTMSIEILKYDKGFDNGHSFGVLWYDNGEKIFSKVYYKINWKDQAFVETKEDYDKIRKMQEARCVNKPNAGMGGNWVKLNGSCVDFEKVAHICNKYHGFKRVKPCDIESVSRYVTTKRKSGTARYLIRFKRMINSKATSNRLEVCIEEKNYYW